MFNRNITIKQIAIVITNMVGNYDLMKFHIA